jgi:hypothetical protein
VLDRVFPKRGEFVEMFRTGQFPDPKAVASLIQLEKEDVHAALATLSESMDRSHERMSRTENYNI